MSKRKAYRPRYVANPLAHLTAMRGVLRLSPAEQLSRAARLDASIKLLGQSKGGPAAWADVFDAINIIEALGIDGPVRDASAFVAEQQDSVVSAMDRQQKTGSNVLRPIELELLQELSATWAQVLAVVTCREYFAAEERVIRKVRQALATGSRPGLRVVEVASA